MHKQIAAILKAWTARLSRARYFFKPRADMPLIWGSNPATPGSLSNEQDPLTVINLNLWHDWPRHRRLPERLEAFARHVEREGAQIVLLQESIRTTEIEAHAWLAERLGMKAVYHRANGNYESIGFEEGLAVLSSLPLGEIRHKTLGRSGGSVVRRVALGVEIKTACARFWVFSTHLSLLPSRNIEQIKDLHHWIADITDGGAALIGGDFNMDESKTRIEKIAHGWIDTFRSRYPEKNVVSHELRWPWGATALSHRLDYLFYQPGDAEWNILESSYLEHPGHPYSDHKAVLTRFDPCQR